MNVYTTLDLTGYTDSNTPMIIDITLVIFAYLSGSIASAIVTCKLMGLSDPREGGSGNPGATNVMRLHGKKAAILTLAGDVLKGVIPVLLAHLFTGSLLIIALCGLAAFLGHVFPLFFNFKGGKGVATLVGVLFATHWLLGTAYVTSWLLTALLFRYSSLSAIVAAILTPAFSWYVLHSIEVLLCHVFIVAVLIWRHRSNIRNLISGTEDKIGEKSGS